MQYQINLYQQIKKFVIHFQLSLKKFGFILDLENINIILFKYV